MATIYTPLRYPGGKSKLSGFVKTLFREHGLCDGHYVEPYAGGAGVALDLLMTEHAKVIHLNDLNYPLYAFWHTVINDSDSLCGRIRRCSLTVNAWRRHRNIVRNPLEHDIDQVGFSFLYLNRTNRSGIINAGVIGGQDQSGNYKMDARFQREELIARIERIAHYAHRIRIYNEDAVSFVERIAAQIPVNSLIYLDPPYFVKGQRLYDNHYKSADHAAIAEVVSRVGTPWIVSYDNVPQIRELYSNFRQTVYDLHYSAASSRTGSEVMVFSDFFAAPVEEIQVA